VTSICVSKKKKKLCFNVVNTQCIQVAKLLWQAKNGIEGGQLSNLARQYADLTQMVEVQGEAGTNLNII
jgi:hypothetical protein